MTALTVQHLDLTGVRSVSFDQGAQSWAIVLPGAGYSAQAPLLWYARRAVMAAGRNAVVVTDTFDRERDEAVSWVEERAAAALSHVAAMDPHPLLVAKSITSLATPFAAVHGLPAVWLTPLIAKASPASEAVLRGLRSSSKPRLLVGGTADPSWDGAALSAMSNADVLELPRADHSLELAGDVGASLEYLRQVTDAIHTFASQLP